MDRFGGCRYAYGRHRAALHSDECRRLHRHAAAHHSCPSSVRPIRHPDPLHQSAALRVGRYHTGSGNTGRHIRCSTPNSFRVRQLRYAQSHGERCEQRRYNGGGLRPVRLARLGLHRFHYSILYHHQCSRLRQHRDAVPDGPCFVPQHRLRHRCILRSAILLPRPYADGRHDRAGDIDECRGMRQYHRFPSDGDMADLQHPLRHGVRQRAALHLEPPHLRRGGHTVRHAVQCRWGRQSLDHGAACAALMASRFLRHHLQQPDSFVRRQHL